MWRWGRASRRMPPHDGWPIRSALKTLSLEGCCHLGFNALLSGRKVRKYLPQYMTSRHWTSWFYSHRRSFSLCLYDAQSSFWDALSYSRNSLHFMEPQVSLLNSQAPTTCSYPEPDQTVHAFIFHFLNIHFNIIILSTLRSALRFPHQNSVYTSPVPLHATHISFFLMWSPVLHLVTSTDCEAHLYVVSFISLPLRPP